MQLEELYILHLINICILIDVNKYYLPMHTDLQDVLTF